jgi:hypothetical protein
MKAVVGWPVISESVGVAQGKLAKFTISDCAESGMIVG